MSKVTVVLPIHEINEDVLNYLEKSIKSVNIQKTKPSEVIIVKPKDLDLPKIDLDVNITLTILENTGKTDFASQVNLGVENVKTEFFSVLEVDDEYSKIWFENVEKYIESYPEVDIFLPIVLDVTPEGKFLHFSNEPVWAKEFSDKLGFLDNDSLLNFPNFQLSGSVIRVESFKSVGGLKSNIKLHFIYEFLLRTTYYDKKIMTLPKLGYKKVNMRPGSLFFNYYNGNDKLDVIEARFWFNTARKESYFRVDREVKFDKETATIQ
jgi:hypothetical protein